jgi:Spy/CpxP family protein refolding chaperone
MKSAEAPYTNRTSLAVKALTPEAIEEYKQAHGMGMAIPAELNGYPGPRHVLDMADELELTAEQKTRLKSIYDSMHDAAVPLGMQIIDRETQLDTSFASGAAKEETVAALTREIGELQGRLRNVHLSAHIATKALLTPHQVEMYVAARGYR